MNATSPLTLLAAFLVGPLLIGVVTTGLLEYRARRSPGFDEKWTRFVEAMSQLPRTHR